MIIPIISREHDEDAGVPASLTVDAIQTDYNANVEQQ